MKMKIRARFKELNTYVRKEREGMKEETTTPKKLLSPKGAIIFSEQLAIDSLSSS